MIFFWAAVAKIAAQVLMSRLGKGEEPMTLADLGKAVGAGVGGANAPAGSAGAVTTAGDTAQAAAVGAGRTTTPGMLALARQSEKTPTDVEAPAFQDKPQGKSSSATAQRGRGIGSTSTRGEENTDLGLLQQYQAAENADLDSQLKREKIRGEQFKNAGTLVKAEKDQSLARQDAYELESAIGAQDPMNSPLVAQDPGVVGNNLNLGLGGGLYPPQSPNYGLEAALSAQQPLNAPGTQGYNPAAMPPGGMQPALPMSDRDAANVASPLLQGMEAPPPPLGGDTWWMGSEKPSAANTAAAEMQQSMGLRPQAGNRSAAPLGVDAPGMTSIGPAEDEHKTQSISNAERALAMATPEGRRQQEQIAEAEWQNAPPPATNYGVQNLHDVMAGKPRSMIGDSLAAAAAGKQQWQALETSVAEQQVPTGSGMGIIHTPEGVPPLAPQQNLPATTTGGKVDAALKQFKAMGVSTPEMQRYLEKQYTEGSDVSKAINQILENPPAGMSAQDQGYLDQLRENRDKTTIARGAIVDKMIEQIGEVDDYRTLRNTGQIQQTFGGILDLLSFGNGLGSSLFGRELGPGEKTRVLATMHSALRPATRMGMRLGQAGSLSDAEMRDIYSDAGVSQSTMEQLQNIQFAAPESGSGKPTPYTAESFAARRKRMEFSQNTLMSLDAAVEGEGNPLQDDTTPEGQGFNAFVHYSAILAKPSRSNTDLMRLVQADMALTEHARKFANQYQETGPDTLDKNYEKAIATMQESIDKTGMGKRNYGTPTRDSLHMQKLAIDRRNTYRQFHADFKRRVNVALGRPAGATAPAKDSTGKPLQQKLKDFGSDIKVRKGDKENLYQTEKGGSFKPFNRLTEKQQGVIGFANSANPKAAAKAARGEQTTAEDFMGEGDERYAGKVPNIWRGMQHLLPKELRSKEALKQDPMVDMPSWDLVAATAASKFANFKNFLDRPGALQPHIEGYGHSGEYRGKGSVIPNFDRALRLYNDPTSKFVPNEKFYNEAKNSGVPISPAFGPKHTIKITKTIPKSKGQTVDITRPFYGWEVDSVTGDRKPLTNFDKAHSLSLFGGADKGRYPALNERFYAEAKRRGIDAPTGAEVSVAGDKGEKQDFVVIGREKIPVYTERDLRDMAVKRFGREIRTLADIPRYVDRLKEELISAGRFVSSESSRFKDYAAAVAAKTKKQEAGQSELTKIRESRSRGGIKSLTREREAIIRAGGSPRAIRGARAREDLRLKEWATKQIESARKQKKLFPPPPAASKDLLARVYSIAETKARIAGRQTAANKKASRFVTDIDLLGQASPKEFDKLIREPRASGIRNRILEYFDEAAKSEKLRKELFPTQRASKDLLLRVYSIPQAKTRKNEREKTEFLKSLRKILREREGAKKFGWRVPLSTRPKAGTGTGK